VVAQQKVEQVEADQGSEGKDIGDFFLSGWGFSLAVGRHGSKAGPYPPRVVSSTSGSRFQRRRNPSERVADALLVRDTARQSAEEACEVRRVPARLRQQGGTAVERVMISN
jgi:hypothetical protein